MKHDFHFSQVVIGGNLNAFLYSQEQGLPLIINELHRPYRFEPEKEKLWNKLYFLLSLSGLNILGDKTNSIRIEDEELAVTTNNSKTIKINFNELIVFDDSLIFNLPLPVEERNKFITLDWMVVKPCAEHDKEHITTNDDFVKDIYFYPTDRIDGNHVNKKDLVAVSYLTKKQLQNFDYSNTYARFKTEKILKENKIIGGKNGFRNGKQINYILKLETKKRETRKLEMNLYKNTKNIKFKYENALQNKTAALEYTNKLNRLLNVL